MRSVRCLHFNQKTNGCKIIHATSHKLQSVIVLFYVNVFIYIFLSLLACLGSLFCQKVKLHLCFKSFPACNWISFRIDLHLAPSIFPTILHSFLVILKKIVCLRVVLFFNHRYIGSCILGQHFPFLECVAVVLSIDSWV